MRFHATDKGDTPFTPEEEAEFENEFQTVKIPEMVTALQGLLAIDQAGLSTAYEAWASNPQRTFS